VIKRILLILGAPFLLAGFIFKLFRMASGSAEKLQAENDAKTSALEGQVAGVKAVEAEASGAVEAAQSKMDEAVKEAGNEDTTDYFNNTDKPKPKP
jgi:hypothetical protein